MTHKHDHQLSTPGHEISFYYDTAPGTISVEGTILLNPHVFGWYCSCGNTKQAHPALDHEVRAAIRKVLTETACAHTGAPLPKFQTVPGYSGTGGVPGFDYPA